MEEKTGSHLPEVTLLFDARGERPENAVGIGEFWYEPEIWTLPLSLAPKVLYASLCSFLKHGEIHRKDLHATLENNSDGEIAEAVTTLVRHGLLVPYTGASLPGFSVRSLKNFED